MPKTLTIELPDEIYEGLQKLAEKWKTTPERIAADWDCLPSRPSSQRPAGRNHRCD